jgi:N-methylhydantoinase B
VIETEHPLEILAMEFVPDTGGAGKFRGGMGFRRDYRFVEEEAVLQVRSDRRAFRPFGLYGGSPGKPSVNIINPQTEHRVVPAKITMTIKRGDVYRHELPGGGGWGDPLDRDPARVVDDARNELVSLRAAREDYGVVIDDEHWKVDEAATASLRATLRARRVQPWPPVVNRSPANGG